MPDQINAAKSRTMTIKLHFTAMVITNMLLLYLGILIWVQSSMVISSRHERMAKLLARRRRYYSLMSCQSPSLQTNIH